MPTKIHDNDVEDKLRLRAFHVFYDKAFANEHDLSVRFVKAIIASAGPVRDREALTEWRRNHCRRPRRP
jgi:hypothetical protein